MADQLFESQADLKVGTCLGVGTQGAVFQAELRGRPVALKDTVFSKRGCAFVERDTYHNIAAQAHREQRCYEEIQGLSASGDVGRACIPAIYGAREGCYRNESYHHLLLLDLLKGSVPFLDCVSGTAKTCAKVASDPKTLERLWAELTHGYHLLCKLGIMQQDMARENRLVVWDPWTPAEETGLGGWHAKIVDFGKSNRVGVTGKGKEGHCGKDLDILLDTADRAGQTMFDKSPAMRAYNFALQCARSPTPPRFCSLSTLFARAPRTVGSVNGEEANQIYNALLSKLSVG